MATSDLLTGDTGWVHLRSVFGAVYILALTSLKQWRTFVAGFVSVMLPPVLITSGTMTKGRWATHVQGCPRMVAAAAGAILGAVVPWGTMGQ